MPPPSKDLAAALLEERALPEEALAKARRDAERGGRPLWAELLDAGVVGEEQIFQALRKHGGVRLLPEERLRGIEVSPELRAAIPRKRAAELGVLPLMRSPDGRRVAVAMVDPTDDIPTLRAAFVRMRVGEVHRFLLPRSVLMGWLSIAYEEPDEARSGDDEREVPLSERPTGLMTLPEHDPRYVQASAARERRDEPTVLTQKRTSPGVGPVARPQRAAITQPLSPVPPAPSRPASVHLDPQLEAEIALLDSAPQHPSSRTPTARYQHEAAERVPPIPRLTVEDILDTHLSFPNTAPPTRLSLLVEGLGARLGLPRIDAAKLAQLVRLTETALAIWDESLSHEAAALRLHEQVRDAALCAALCAELAALTPRLVVEESRPYDADPTHKHPLPESADQAADPPSDPEVEIEPADISDAGLAVYQHEEN